MTFWFENVFKFLKKRLKLKIRRKQPKLGKKHPHLNWNNFGSAAIATVIFIDFNLFGLKLFKKMGLELEVFTYVRPDSNYQGWDVVVY